MRQHEQHDRHGHPCLVEVVRRFGVRVTRTLETVPDPMMSWSRCGSPPMAQTRALSPQGTGTTDVKMSAAREATPLHRGSHSLRGPLGTGWELTWPTNAKPADALTHQQEG
jgi:hypothetical protein